jgi:hypothetical protein
MFEVFGKASNAIGSFSHKMKLKAKSKLRWWRDDALQELRQMEENEEEEKKEEEAKELEKRQGSWPRSVALSYD